MALGNSSTTVLKSSSNFPVPHPNDTNTTNNNLHFPEKYFCYNSLYRLLEIILNIYIIVFWTSPC